MLRRSLALLAALPLVACGSPGAAPADVERVQVSADGECLELTQRFDDDGALLETRVRHRRGDDERVVRAIGPLMTAAGETDQGARIRRTLGTVDPALLARLRGVGLRWDLAVLLADAMLELPADGRRDAAAQLAGSDDPGAALCVLLETCGGPDAVAPQT
ncbi:MAG TPA: hypothetical protein RMH99_23590 [Sandaracinaceae bacterium LLY-WYZ-13_1]|nr:hypothetical protein [Sandaracinaceae bacterium LLY-WYZ-13_1]